MLKTLLMLLGLVFVPSAGFAATGINGTTTFCSGVQTASSILGSPLTLSCTGDFALSGGTITDSLGIFLSSTGALTLDNISITAPTVSFSAGTLFSMTPSALISATNTSISAPTITMNGVLAAPGVTLSTASPFSVPSATLSGATLSTSSGSLILGRNITSVYSLASPPPPPIFPISNALVDVTTSLNPGGGGTLTISGTGGTLVNTASGGVLTGTTLISPVPEPGSYLTLLLGLLCLAGLQLAPRARHGGVWGNL